MLESSQVLYTIYRVYIKEQIFWSVEIRFQTENDENDRPMRVRRFAPKKNNSVMLLPAPANVQSSPHLLKAAQ
jgi:hypothetical protein